MPSPAASSAPATTSSGALSPPSASTATRVNFLGGRCAERLDLATRVRLAVRAHPVRLLRPPALRARVHPRRLDLVRRTALVAAGLRRFLLGDGHRAASIATAFCQGLTEAFRALGPGLPAPNRPAVNLSEVTTSEGGTACTRSQQSSEESC